VCLPDGGGAICAGRRAAASGTIAGPSDTIRALAAGVPRIQTSTS